MNQSNIAVIGTGNLAWHLSIELEKAGYSITDIAARDRIKAIELSNTLYETNVVNNFDFSESSAEIFFLCVSDDAILEVANKLVLPENAIVVHTSGTKPMSDLQAIFDPYDEQRPNVGVFYPLMTFTRGKPVDFKEIPICIEAENDFVKVHLLSIAQTLSNDVSLINSEERLALHIAAVFSCNFTNHLWALSKEILESEGLDFDMLHPIIHATVKKALLAKHPAEVQTGPAKRHDENTIKKHMDYLSEDEDLRTVYKTLTSSINDWHLD